MNFFIVLPLLLCVSMLSGLHAESIWQMSPDAVRDRINQKIMATEGITLDVASVEDKTCSNTHLRIYHPNNKENLPLILFIHGGAWVAGSIETHDNLARYLCQKSEAIVVSVGYTNAPVGKFPLPLEECYDALTWVSNEFKNAKIAVVGDSSGGELAASLCLLARDRKGAQPVLQVLINPSTDLTCAGTLLAQNDALDTMRWFAVQFVQDAKDVYNPYVSPLLAEDLSKLPPALILLAENDPQRLEGQKYADRLSAAGTKAETYIQLGVTHLAGNAARVNPLALESLDVACSHLRIALH